MMRLNFKSLCFILFVQYVSSLKFFILIFHHVVKGGTKIELWPVYSNVCFYPE